MAEKLTNYEKGTLAILGCIDVDTTITCLKIAAAVAKQDEDRKKLQKLLDRIENERYYDYSREYQLLSYEMECRKNLFIREYQYSGGVNDDNAPWKNYLKAKFADSICTDDKDQSVFHLNLLASVIPSAEIREIIHELIDTLNDCFEKSSNYYEFYLTNSRMIAGTAKSRLKRGRDAYRLYTMWIPDWVA